ncbi:nuclear transport factor 2 family protein [Nocardioides bruguierae]|uniref:nuclear transport factor 2 family protein n=1 Tax=Nocardioides bruguierae TaxID=2945102 RepID=UPI002022885D|nr:nuclear transport factor 2 family protein [Nocardioides bruguierae]MCL8024688.1 nuclear transport factor 2 family protein [Nocardioides bruguierae]
MTSHPPRSPAAAPSAASVVRSLWAACDARDWAGFAALLHPDVVMEVPQTRERVRGREAFTRFNAEYPGPWTLRVTRLVTDEESGTVATWIAFDPGEGSGQADDGVQTGIAAFTVRDGLVTAMEDWWPEPYAPPPGRSHLVERY